MKKTLTILSLLSVLFLSACEEGVDSESLRSEFSGFSQFTLSEENPVCSINFSISGDVVYRNGVLHDPSLPNLNKYEEFPVNLSDDLTYYDAEYGKTYILSEVDGLYDLEITNLEGQESTFTNIEISEDELGPFMNVRVECAEGLTELKYRLSK